MRRPGGVDGARLRIHSLAQLATWQPAHRRLSCSFCSSERKYRSVAMRLSSCCATTARAVKHVNPSLVDGFEMETATPNALAIAAEESSAPAGAPPPAFPQLKRRGKGKEKAEPEDEPAEEEIPSPPPPDFGGDQNDASDERCFDCDQPILAYNSWMSATYGITLCLECAGVHRGFGVQTSFVRSLALDTLTAREARTLHILNGNEGFGKFLADPSRGVPRRVWLALPLQTRYHTPAADLFRRKMKAALDEEELGEPHLAVQLPVTADDAGHATELGYRKTELEI